MEPVEAQLVLDPKENQKTACDTQCEARDVDERVLFMLFVDSQSDFEIGFDHDESPNDTRPDRSKA